jgi:23S rRNA (pseudouridine1915-N3)-methyltransferase
VARTGGALSAETDRYISLARPYVRINLSFVRPWSGQDDGRPREEKQMEDLWPQGAYSVAMTEDGRQYDSRGFAIWLNRRMEAGVPLIINIGGAHGLTDDFKKRCRETVSLSRFTFPHALALLLTAEQLYRACTILKSHPYHK